MHSFPKTNGVDTPLQEGAREVATITQNVKLTI